MQPQCLIQTQSLESARTSMTEMRKHKSLCTYFHSSKCFQLGYSHSQSILSFCQVYSFRHNYRWQFFLIFYIQRFKLLKQIILWSQEGNLKPLTTNPYLKVHKAFSKKKKKIPPNPSKTPLSPPNFLPSFSLKDCIKLT